MDVAGPVSTALKDAARACVLDTRPNKKGGVLVLGGWRMQNGAVVVVSDERAWGWHVEEWVACTSLLIAFPAARPCPLTLFVAQQAPGPGRGPAPAPLGCRSCFSRIPLLSSSSCCWPMSFTTCCLYVPPY